MNLNAKIQHSVAQCSPSVVASVVVERAVDATSDVVGDEVAAFVSVVVGALVITAVDSKIIVIGLHIGESKSTQTNEKSGNPQARKHAKR